MKIWRQRLGSSATYKKLISIFELSGYYSYADEVRKVAGVEDDEDDDINDEDEAVIQPQTYPPVKRHMSLDIPSPVPISQEQFLLVKPDAAQHLPKSKSKIVIMFMQRLKCDHIIESIDSITRDGLDTCIYVIH